MSNILGYKASWRDVLLLSMIPIIIILSQFNIFTIYHYFLFTFLYGMYAGGIMLLSVIRYYAKKRGMTV